MNYFKPMRRKLGVLTLLVACLFTAGWVRSDAKYDNLNLAIGASTFVIESMEGAVRLSRSAPMPIVELFDYRFSSADLAQAKSLMKWDQWYGYRLSLLWRFAGFEAAIGTGEMRRSIHFAALTIPYWAIVLPLILLAAYLLLSKPRQKPVKAQA